MYTQKAEVLGIQAGSSAATGGGNLPLEKEPNVVLERTFSWRYQIPTLWWYQTGSIRCQVGTLIVGVPTTHEIEKP